MKNLKCTNRKLITLLYHLIQCPTQKEVAKKALTEMPELNQDSYGNLFIIHPNTPMLCAHMDNVWTYEDHKKLKSVGFRQNKKWQWDSIVWAGNLWADDKCWVAIALYLKKKLWDKVSILLTKDEETWWIGITKFCKENEALLDNINYAIIPDRRWAWDIICTNNEYWTEEFQTAIQGFLKPFGYAPSTWTFSDCDTLSTHMNCANLSCWYHNAHTSQEFIHVNQFENCCNAIEKLITTYNTKLPKPEKTCYSYSNGFRKDNFRDDVYGKINKKDKWNSDNWFTYSHKAKCNIFVDNQWDIYNEDLEWLGWVDPDTWEEIYDWYIENDNDSMVDEITNDWYIEDDNDGMVNTFKIINDCIIEITKDIILDSPNKKIYLEKWFYSVSSAEKNSWNVYL